MYANFQRRLFTLSLLFVSLLIASRTSADPLPGEVLKFSQRPMNGTPIFTTSGLVNYWGHDELSTAYSEMGAAGPTPYRGTFMADDFADKLTKPVVHVRWWGSYLNQATATLPVNKFLISFETDVPATTANPFSRPGTPLLNQIITRTPPTSDPVYPVPGSFTEKFVGPGGPPRNEALYEYNAELHLDKHFFEQANTVYWLKIVALVDLPQGVTADAPFIPKWGWHNRDYTIPNPLASTAPAVIPGEYQDGNLPGLPTGPAIWHFQDDAVSGAVVVNHLTSPMGPLMPLVDQAQFEPKRYLAGVDGPPAIGDHSKDLAFELFTVPEPSASALLVVCVVGISGVRRRFMAD